MAKKKVKDVSKNTKKAIKDSADDKCWFCNRKGTEVAHVIAKKRSDLFNMYFLMGLFGEEKINSHVNLFYLCSNCHDAFDLDVPTWIFLPNDLKSLLETEEQFQRDRESVAKNGERLCRSAPTLGGREFTRYQILESTTQAEVLESTQVKIWDGNPITAIVHSAEVIYKHVRLDPVEKYGLPDDVVETLQKLLFLYGKQAPKVTRKLENIEKSQDATLVQEPKVTGSGSKRKRADTTNDGTCDDDARPPGDAPQTKRPRRAYPPTERTRRSQRKANKDIRGYFHDSTGNR